MARKNKQQLAQEFEQLNQELIQYMHDEEQKLYGDDDEYVEKLDKELEDEDVEFDGDESDLDEEFPPDEPFAVVDERDIDYDHIEEDKRYILVDDRILLSRLNAMSKLVYMLFGSYMKQDIIHELDFQELAKQLHASEQIAYDALDALLMYLEVDQMYLPDSWQKAMDEAKQLLNSTDKEALSNVQ